MTHIFTTIEIAHWSTFFFLFSNVRHLAYIYNVLKSAVDTDLLSFLAPKKGLTLFEILDGRGKIFVT